MPQVELLNHVLSISVTAPGYRRRQGAVRLVPQNWRVCLAFAIALPGCLTTPSTIKTGLLPLLFPL